MDKHFYRFRTVNALLGEHLELKNQEIYFASPQELNDPMEGFKDLFWKGDQILWSNLLEHYLLCLMKTVFRAIVCGSDYIFSPDQDFIFSSQTLETEKSRELLQRIFEKFYKHIDIKYFQLLLTLRKSLIKRDELTFYLRLLHLHGLNSVLIAMEDSACIPVRPPDDPLRSASIKSIACKKMLELFESFETRHQNEPSIVEELSRSINAVQMQQNLILEYNGISLRNGRAWQFIISDFPKVYVDQLERLLHYEWYTACFMESPLNAAVWGHYGDGHKGICLKFKASADEDQNAIISLKQIIGESSNRGICKPVYGQVAHAFQKVEYQSHFTKIDFFQSLGRLTPPMLKFWHQDANGNTSPLVKDMLSETPGWRKQYWENFETAIDSKLADWSYEGEYRLTLHSTIADLTEKPKRKLTYNLRVCKD